MKERENGRAKKPNQVVAEGRPSDGGGGCGRLGTIRASGVGRFCV